MSKKDIDYYVSLNYTIETIKIDDYYLVRIVELPGCQTTANTLEQALSEIEQVKCDYLEIKLKYGDQIPEPGIHSVSEVIKPKSAFLRDHKNIAKLEAIPTADFAFEEIAGDPNKFIIYYSNGVLTKKDGLGNITQYVDSELVLLMDILKAELKQVIIESDAPFVLQERLINVISEIIDKYVEEKEKDDETGQ